MTKLPSRRTLLKFGRDLALAIVALVLTYVADNAADLNLGESGTAILVAVALFGHRWIRGVRGAEPS